MKLLRAGAFDVLARHYVRGYWGGALLTERWAGNRHDTKRWIKAFRPLLTVAGDMVEEGRFLAAIQILLDMVSLADACSITYERKPHDSSQLWVTFNGVEIREFADGTFLDVASGDRYAGATSAGRITGVRDDGAFRFGPIQGI